MQYKGFIFLKDMGFVRVGSSEESRELKRKGITMPNSLRICRAIF